MVRPPWLDSQRNAVQAAAPAAKLDGPAKIGDDQAVTVIDSMGLDRTETAPVIEWFSDANLQPALLAQVADLGFKKPTKIQKHAIPLCQEGKDKYKDM